LRATGRVVVDPDYVCSWTMHQSSNDDVVPPEGFSPPSP
jgi:hypothetical protein